MKFFSALLLLMLPIVGNAQIIENARITYERKMNVHRQMEGNEWFDRMKSRVPQFMTTNHVLYLMTGKSFWKPGVQAESPEGRNMFSTPPVAENRVYTDLITHSVTASKPIFEQKFLVVDTQRQLKWTIKEEVRNIAGHNCRKAVTVILDSVYVVAFYAEDFPASAGPESFGGLPGVILELAIPRLYSTWIANKIEIGVAKSEDFEIPDKGKKVTQKELFDAVWSSTKSWGDFAKRNLWWSML